MTCLRLLLLTLPLLACAAPQQDEPIRVLLITGGGWHDYETQQTLLTEGLSERLNRRIQWTVVHEGDGNPEHLVSVIQKDGWTTGYDVVVHNTGFGRVRDSDYVAHLAAQHLGTPAVLIHSAIHSYRFAEPADPWFEFTGMQSMWHEDQRPLDVENLAPDHPIMQGFPSTWTTPYEELYVIERTWGEITPLARAYGVETDAFHTVTWTHEGDGIRVFATTLGHNNDMFEQDEFLDKVARGLLWAIGEL